jgi:hypothetical protein
VDDDLKGIFEDFKSNLEGFGEVVKTAGKKPSKSKI